MEVFINCRVKHPTFRKVIFRVITLDSLKKLFRDSVQISFQLFKIMVPTIIVVKILLEFGIIDVLGRLLSPVMELVGLPGSVGLVWATAASNTVYASLIVFVSICADHPLTIAQTTVLATIILVAHALPVELMIARKAGARALPMALLRVGTAFIMGWCLYHIYAWGNWLQEMNVISWIPPGRNASLTDWIIGQVRLLAMIFVILTGLLALLRILAYVGITGIITRMLQPVLTLLGIGQSASTITIIGMTLGLTYGGGLIIQEATSNRISKRDIFFSLSLMGLSHSLIEDTFLLAFLGASFSGMFWGRIFFSLIFIFLLVKWVSHLSDATFERYFFKSRPVDGGTRSEAHA